MCSSGFLNPMTLLTGLRTTNPVGMVVDPLNLSGKFSPRKPPKLEATSAPDPEAERLAAEAEATRRANAKIVERQRRRRGQNNLLATLGGDQDALGTKDNNADGYTAIVGQPAPMGYVTAGRSSAANVLGGGGGYGGGGGMGRSGYRTARV